MLLHIPHLKNNPHKGHSAILSFAGGFGLSRIATALFYLILPIIITAEYNIGVAGIIIGAANALSTIICPISGIIADKKGTLTSIKIHILLFILGAIIWLIGKNGPLTLFLMCFCMFAGFGFQIREPYVLKFSKHKEGGKMFGLFTAIIGIGYFCGTMLLPFFKENYYPRIPVIIVATMGMFLAIIYSIPSDKQKNVREERSDRKKEMKESMQIHKHITEGINFIKNNKGYPLFSLTASLFDGVYFSGIRFLLPLVVTGTSPLEGLSLGIYEFTTIFLSGICGHIADKRGRRGINIIGRTLIIIGCITMIFTQETNALIIIGAIIGIGNSLFYGASMHVLEEHDTHHHADGRFSAFKNLVLNIGYVVIPLLMGRLYHSYNFQTAITTLMIITTALATTMIVLTVRKS